MLRTIGPYEVLAMLGSGGMGEVYLAKTVTASKVAVKVIRTNLADDPLMRARFMDEVDHLRMAFGARVARFEDANLDANPPWLAAEYVPGLTLRQHVEANGPLPPDLGAILGAVLAEGVEAIHKANLVHRDLKPHNVIMGKDGPVIIDFGLAILVNREEHLTLTGHAVGTPAYMAPEQARGETDLTAKADIYALGATLVFAVAGHTLYPGTGVHELARRVIDLDDHPDLTGVPAKIAGLIGMMLAHDPAARPEARQVKQALIDVVKKSRHRPEALRRRLRESTYVEPSLSFPADVDDPVADPECVIDDVATEHVHPLSVQPPTVTVPGPRPPADVSRLVAKLRTDYGRGGNL